MKKVTILVLILCLFLSGTYSHALCATKMEKDEDETPITIIEKTSHGGPDRSVAIHSFLNGHYLTVSFSQNFGPVSMVVTTATGLLVDSVNLLTSIGWQFYIPDEGDYVVTFTFIDGDEYYGEFSITD